MRLFSGNDTTSYQFPTVAHARGCYVTDASGKRYIDGSGGPAVFSLGHAHAEVNAAIEAQLGRIAHGYRYSFTSDALERLTRLVQQQAGPGFEHMVFVSGGSEAMESALKIALQYHWCSGEPSRTRFIARQRSYHGNTLGALAVSGFAQRRKPFENALTGCSFVSPANSYRLPAGVAAAAYPDYLAHELEREIRDLGPENVAAFVIEPVVGAAGGVVPAPPGYAAAVREVCDRYGVLLIADEVMCGAGRCGTWRALEYDDIRPDIMTLAKGLGGGYVPLGAACFSTAVGLPIFADGGAPNTGHTFTGHTLACAGAAAVQEIVIREGLVERVQRDGEPFREQLQQRLSDLDTVGDVRGRGFFVGIELVANRDSREPLDPALALHERIRRQAMELGLICYPVGGTLDGVRGDVAILAPPYIATDDELGEIADKFERTVRKVLDEVVMETGR